MNLLLTIDKVCKCMRNYFIVVGINIGVKGQGEVSFFPPAAREIQDSCVAIRADIAAVTVGRSESFRKVLIGHDQLDMRSVREIWNGVFLIVQ